MRITAELSLYPIGPQRGPQSGSQGEASPIDRIIAFVGDIQSDERLEVIVNQMSTQIRGELDDVMGRIRLGIEKSFAAGDAQVLVAKFLNADLPIGEAPDLTPGQG